MSKILENLKYTKDHEWARFEGGNAWVGITDHAQGALGDIVFVELPKKGTELKTGRPFGVVESVKAVSELFSPVDGVVVEVNAKLGEDPSTLNRDPYGEGWIVKIETKSGASASGLMSAGEYQKII